MEGDGYEHPLLRGGNDDGGYYSHGFSKAQMGALSAMCGALIPSLPMDEIHGHGDTGRWDPPRKNLLQPFYLASTSQPPIPDESRRSSSSAVAAWKEAVATWKEADRGVVEHNLHGRKLIGAWTSTAWKRRKNPRSGKKTKRKK